MFRRRCAAGYSDAMGGLYFTEEKRVKDFLQALSFYILEEKGG